jgi:hypothetical protein
MSTLKGFEFVDANVERFIWHSSVVEILLNKKRLNSFGIRIYKKMGSIYKQGYGYEMPYC